ncbi:hypothetical protein K0U83_10160 [bacterium]|nr:hypothetical protein [bacterium]
MAFRNYDRKLFAATESTGGTAATITPATDFIETVAPTFTITPLQFERQPKTMTFTGAPMTVAGTAKNLPASTVEFTFAVELCGPGTGVASGTAPEFDALLLACGLEKDNVFFYDVDATTFDGTFFNKENIDGTTGGAYSSSVGKSFGDNAFGDGDFLATSATALTGGSTHIAGQRSGKLVEADALAATQIGVGYRPKSANSDDTNVDTSATIRLYLDKAGSYVEGVGCRGTFDIAFVHGDRALINFTFMGALNAYVEDSDPTEYNYTMEVPPAWINTGLQFGLADSIAANYTGALFNALTFTLGNETTMHENTNQRSGYRSAIIQSRAPQLTFNPDMVLSSDYDFWNAFLSGAQSRLRWTLGNTAGNKVEFRCAAAQFTGITDGERDTISILDSTTMLTGGTYGSSLITDGGTQTSSTLGADNEFQLLFR